MHGPVALDAEGALPVDPGPGRGRDSLAADQRAVLDLLLSRGLGLSEIARVTGLAEDGVRARAGAAVTALAGREVGADVAALLLGVAEPAQRRTAQAALRRDAARREAAGDAAAALVAGWPGYDAPALPAPGASAARTWGRSMVAGGLLAVSVVAGLLLTGVIGGGGGDDGGGARTGRAATPAPVRIALVARGGLTARGRATIGVTATYRPYMQLDLTGLPTPPRGVVYLLWADDGTGHGYPLPTPITAAASGEFHQRYALSTALAPLLRVSRSLDLVAVDASRLAALSKQVTAAGKAGGTLPKRPGVVVLRGRIP